MSRLNEDLEKLYDLIVLPKPKFNLVATSSGVALKQVERVYIDSDGILAALLVHHVEAVWNNKYCRYEAQVPTSNHPIIYSMISTIRNFIKDNSPAKNPRLTSLYRWYVHLGNTASHFDYPDLTDTIYEIYKYMMTEVSSDRIDNTLDNTLAVLEVVKDKYERKGLKIDA